MNSPFPIRRATPAASLKAALLAGAALWTGVLAAVAPTPAAATPAGAGSPPIWSSDVRALDELAGAEIRVLVWNVQKGRKDDWVGDFRSMSSASDLVLLQEAHLREEFASGLVDLPRWDMVDSWNFLGMPTGVLTASTAAPISVRALERREPLLRTDKSALLTEYRLAGSRQTLLVANVHAINFTPNTRAFRAQLMAIAELVREHRGPVILCGDLNTWRAGRRAIVDAMAASLGLIEVAFVGPRKTFGRFPLDHVFYRDLELLDADVPALRSSDHNPLLVRFRNPARAADATL